MSNKVTCLILLLWLLLGGCSCGPLANRGPQEQDAAITSLLNCVSLRPIFSKGTSYVGIKTTGAVLPKRFDNYCSPLSPLRLALGIEKKALPNGSQVMLSPVGSKSALRVYDDEYELEIEPLGKLQAFGHEEPTSYELLFVETGGHGDEMPLVLFRILRNGNLLEEGKMLECTECLTSISACSGEPPEAVLNEWKKVSVLLNSVDLMDAFGPLVPGADACMTAQGETQIQIDPSLRSEEFSYDEACSRRLGFLVLSNPMHARLYVLVGQMGVPPISITSNGKQVRVKYKVDTHLEKLIVNDQPQFVCRAEKLNPTLVLFDGARYFTRYSNPLEVKELAHRPLK